LGTQARSRLHWCPIGAVTPVFEPGFAHERGIRPHLAHPTAVGCEGAIHVRVAHLPSERRDRDAGLEAVKGVAVAQVVRGAIFEAGRIESRFPDLAPEVGPANRPTLDVEDAARRESPGTARMAATPRFVR
jgi:hypothetical protein